MALAAFLLFGIAQVVPGLAIRLAQSGTSGPSGSTLQTGRVEGSSCLGLAGCSTTPIALIIANALYSEKRRKMSHDISTSFVAFV